MTRCVYSIIPKIDDLQWRFRHSNIRPDYGLLGGYPLAAIVISLGWEDEEERVLGHRTNGYIDTRSRSRSLGCAYVIIAHSNMRGVITYPCARYRLLAPKSSCACKISLSVDCFCLTIFFKRQQTAERTLLFSLSDIWWPIHCAQTLSHS